MEGYTDRLDEQGRDYFNRICRSQSALAFSAVQAFLRLCFEMFRNMQGKTFLFAQHIPIIVSHLLKSDEK